jgi:hypothetical protein
MQTKTYSDLLTRIQAHAGINFTTSERERVKSLINFRAKMAYDRSLYWPRFLIVGEARAISSQVVPWTESSLDNIGIFIQIHKDQPFVRNSVVEYNFYVTNSGAYVTGVDTSLSSVYVTYKKQFSDTYGDGVGEETDIPAEWFDYLAYGAYADFLRMDELNEKAALEDRNAEQALVLELLNIDRQHTTQIVGKRIFTHTNNQGRQT